MKTGCIELAFTVSARDLGKLEAMLRSEQWFRNLPVMMSLYFHVLHIVVFPFVWIALLLVRNKVVHGGAQQMIAGPEDLTVRRVAWTAVYRWAAIREMRKTRSMILLMLTSMHAIPVPRRAFASKTDERRFCDFVRDRIADTAKSSQESVSVGYRYT